MLVASLKGQAEFRSGVDHKFDDLCEDSHPLKINEIEAITGTR